MNMLLNTVFNAIASEKATSFFFLLRIFLITLICYDFELDCCLQKTLHDCKVWYKERVLPVVAKYLLGLPTLEYERELEEEIVRLEKEANEIGLAFVQKKKEIRKLEYDLYDARTEMDWVYDELEDFEDRVQSRNRMFWMAKYASSIEEEEHALLVQQLAEAQDDVFV